MELKNEKTESVNENKNKANKNVNEFQEYISQQKPANRHKSETTKRHEDLECHIISPLLTKLVRSRYLISLVSLFASLWTSTSSP